MNQIEISCKARMKWATEDSNRNPAALQHIVTDLRASDRHNTEQIGFDKLVKCLVNLPSDAVISFFDRDKYSFGDNCDIFCGTKQNGVFKGVAFHRMAERTDSTTAKTFSVIDLVNILIRMDSVNINVLTEKNYLNLLDYENVNSDNDLTETAGGNKVLELTVQLNGLAEFIRGDRSLPSWVKNKISSSHNDKLRYSDYLEDYEGKLTLMYNTDSYCHQLVDRESSYCDYIGVYYPLGGKPSIFYWRGNRLSYAGKKVDIDSDIDDYMGNTLRLNHSHDEWRFVQIDLPVDNTQQLSNNNSTSQQGNTKMANIKTAATTALTANKTAALTAAKIEAGRIATKQAVAMIKPHLPMMVRGYAETPVGELIVANLFSLMIQNFAPQNEKAVLVADAMLNGAMLGAVQSLNVEKLINDVMSKVDVSKFAESLTKE